ncbi:hypothetical protein EMEDMD4_100091 [Sinorhizobium medicae]|uniref:Uncharacterized protein n=1 Tax=Sinorhizobium medicae TaxID=110321 RepID=A0A508WNU4_9HYPH|nr:hypothetical protein EMEDMD4_100091 [Sinorhizobium medicae]
MFLLINAKIFMGKSAKLHICESIWSY